jgi:hypothetical protein
MAKAEKTCDKPANKPGKGGIVLPPTPKPFSPENQPSGKAKSDGWKKIRAQRLLTQSIIAHMLKGTNLQSFTASLQVNAKKGNAKAIETIVRAMEDEVIKIAHTDAEGNDAPLVILQNDPASHPLKDE